MEVNLTSFSPAFVEVGLARFVTSRVASGIGLRPGRIRARSGPDRPVATAKHTRASRCRLRTSRLCLRARARRLPASGVRRRPDGCGLRLARALPDHDARRLACRPELLAPEQNPVTHEPDCPGIGGLSLAAGRKGDPAVASSRRSCAYQRRPSAGTRRRAGFAFRTRRQHGGNGC